MRSLQSCSWAGDRSHWAGARVGVALRCRGCVHRRDRAFALPYAFLCVVIFLAGMTIIGSQTGVNGACGKLYPARMRTSGIGWALGIGRIGGIVAPVLGGYLLAVGLPPTHIFLIACLLFALIAAAATALLVFRNTRVESA